MKQSIIRQLKKDVKKLDQKKREIILRQLKDAVKEAKKQKKEIEEFIKERKSYITNLLKKKKR